MTLLDLVSTQCLTDLTNKVAPRTCVLPLRIRQKLRKCQLLHKEEEAVHRMLRPARSRQRKP